MTQTKEILHILPFKSDNWKSIFRYSNQIRDGLNQEKSNLHVSQYIPSESLKKAGSFIARRILLPFKVKQNAYDVIHICDASYSNLLPKKDGALRIITCHDLEFWRSKNVFNYLVRYNLLRKLFQADIIVVPSDTIKEELLDLAEQMNGEINCKVIHNCVSDIFFSRSKKNLNEVFNFLYVGNSHWPRKNFSFLIQVLKNLKQSGLDFKLKYVGPSLSSKHAKEIKESGIQHNIEMYNNISDEELVALYSDCDFVLVPSTYEGFGYPLIEAAAAQTPFLASDIPVFREVSMNKIELLKLDVNLWAERIRSLYSDRSQILEMQTQCRLIAKNYTEKKFFEKYAELYYERK